MRVGGWLLVVAGVAVCRSAKADDAEPIRVEYAAPDGCPAKEEFVRGVLGRTSRAHEAGAEKPARTFVVTLSSGANDESRGQLVMRGADGTESERELAGDTCGEVVDALALIAALAIDPHASAVVAPVPAPTPIPVIAVTPREAPIAPPPRKHWRLAASAEGAVAAGVAPSSLFGVPVAVHALAPIGGAFSPSLHLAFERTSSGTLDVTGGAATFTWTIGVFEGCPHRWAFHDFEVAPCVRFEAGALEGEGSRIVPAREATHAWVALGAVARAEWTFAGPFFVELDAGARAPFVRTTYFFQPDTTIYRAPVVGAVADAGLGVRFL